MSGVNKVFIVGNIGNKEVKEAGHSTVANLSIATSESWKDKETGERKEATEWHNIVLWGQPAKFAEQFLDKGDKVYVEGKLKTRNWEDDGVKKYRTEIIGNQIQNLGSKKDSGNQEDIPF